jgi:hypothetical protein
MYIYKKNMRITITRKKTDKCSVLITSELSNKYHSDLALHSTSIILRYIPEHRNWIHVCAIGIENKL